MNSKASTLKSTVIKPRKKNKNARIASQQNNFNVKRLFKDHKYAYFDSIKNLYTAPISNILTLFILGFTLALPIVLYILVSNINTNLTIWQNNLYQYTIYLDSNYSNSKINSLNEEISNWPEVEKTEIISKSQGLTELKTIMGLGDILDNLEHNPLPTVLIVNLKSQYQNLPNLKTLIDKSKKISGATKVEADIYWLEKVSSMLKLSFKVIYIFSAALALAVLLVIGNTIRLNIQSKLTEMKIYSLLGATNNYIRRPYLYDGVLYGLFTAIIALAIAKFLYSKIAILVSELGYNQLFNNKLMYISNDQSMQLLITSAALGWLGARVTLYWQLKSLKTKLIEL